MAADDHLSPNQFEHAGFEKWTRQQERDLRAKHTVKKGAISYTSFPPEAGRRVAQLRQSREMLLDFGSMDYYAERSSGNRITEMPLHELLPENYHHLVDEYRSGR